MSIAKTLFKKTPLTSLGSGLLHLFYPRLCEGCRRPLITSEEVICISCETFLARTNYHHIPENETAVRLAGRIPFQNATSFAYFSNESLLQHLIHDLKYKGKEQIGTYLGRELGKAIKSNNCGIDAVVPVPLYKKKEFTRGYNQSIMIAEGIAEILSVPLLSEVLTRNRHTESQTDKTREQRINNVANAFSIKNIDTLTGKHILLVDDVLTTGATIESCALTLLSGKDVRLSIATVGIAVG